ncbi:MAG: hypothetical protein KAJ07_10840 [Planctomycetes bacterium]|nr:hypothetical protein [Planctomycetota bacterium]
MKAKLMRRIIPVFAIFFLTSICGADTFENVKTGESFNGFMTQKVRQGRTYVYSEVESKFNAINLNDWRVTSNELGRRNSVAVIQLDAHETLLSKVISDSVAEAIIDSSNKGVLAILIEIDLPGGRGEYAKNLCDAIQGTTNCPVIAFINGGNDGGAYSAAAAVALACDKIYIAGIAVIGSAAPITGSGGYYGDDFAAIFNSDNLAAYKSYTALLAESKGRPGIMAMAMVDSQVDVIEITSKDGKKSFINRENRIPSQTVLRSWSSKKIYIGPDNEKTEKMSLVLQPKDAVYAKMADGVVGSRQDVLNALDASDAKLLRRSGQIEKTAKKFIATRRTLSNIVADIDYLQERSDSLTTQIDKIQNQATTTTKRMLDDGYGPVYNRPIEGRVGSLQYDRYESPNTRARRRQVGVDSGTMITETRPTITADELLDELSLVLVDLTRNYNRAIVLGRRFPGALPLEITVGTLEKRLYRAEALYDDVAYRR